ncbi:unnamed protein product [Rotaria sordida]|uniref:Uncharacterized protein n=1 Tax=Rotaria sordida TaxID=392033 RepID=A0A814ZY43_9BILA|nr:unnamed protein product [Rotaria sordida]CAF1529129.1 unnamed protein product [Rotaria sordida]
MELHDEPKSEKMVMIDNASVSVVKSLSATNDSKIRRIRKNLLIILSICLGLTGMILITTYFFQTAVFPDSKYGYLYLVVLIGVILILIVFYSFGIFVTSRYHHTGLRVFAWLNIIYLIILGITLIGLFLLLIPQIIHVNNRKGGPIGLASAFAIAMLLLFIIICLTAFIITVFIVKFVFKLVRLIANNKCLTT